MVVDAVINSLGKPWQTALTVLSLLRYSGYAIRTLYLIEEHAGSVQTFLMNRRIRRVISATSVPFLRERFPEKIVVHRNPKTLWLFRFRETRRLQRSATLRHRVRYQYAWEASDADLLFISHNDCVYKKDIIGYLGATMEQAPELMGVGTIGQCWNCPAYYQHRCSPTTYTAFKPDFDELKRLYETSRARNHTIRWPRTPGYLRPFRKHPWPLPECRLNEWAALIHLKRARKRTIPHGSGFPFGAYFRKLDIGVAWFREMNWMHEMFVHRNIDAYVEHGAGHPAMTDPGQFRSAEEKAKRFLKEHYSDEAKMLEKLLR